MTPATSILHYFSKAASGLPVHFEQAEDEIAAINMALGASYAGVRSMAATSGGGFALMQEAVSLAGMTETPIVIAVSQRPGPATGLPTRTEQADLNFVLHAGHGEFPRIIFAPGSIEETIALARKSFDLADRYQIPVFMLTDQYFADSVQIVEEEIPLDVGRREYPDLRPDLQAVPSDGRRHLSFDLSRAFRRPGQARLRRARRRGENHGGSEICGSGWWTSAGRNSRSCRKEAVLPTFYGDRNAASFILCWGSNEAHREGSRGEAHRRRHSGRRPPFRAGLSPDAGDGRPVRLEEKRLICVENNAGGQFARLLKTRARPGRGSLRPEIRRRLLHRGRTLSNPERSVVLKEKK